MFVILAFQATGNIVGQFADRITDTFIVSLLHKQLLRNEPGSSAIGSDKDIAHPVTGYADYAGDIRIHRRNTLFHLTGYELDPHVVQERFFGGAHQDIHDLFKGNNRHSGASCIVSIVFLCVSMFARLQAQRRA
jgi:hypothetical protein